MDTSRATTFNVRLADVCQHRRAGGGLRQCELLKRTLPGGRALVLAVALLVSLIPRGASVQEATSVADAVAGTPLEVKIGQMILAGVQDETASDDSRHIIDDLHVGTIILMGRNFDSPEQVLRLTRDLQDLAMSATAYPC